jgi:hypothetical protein
MGFVGLTGPLLEVALRAAYQRAEVYWSNRVDRPLTRRKDCQKTMPQGPHRYAIPSETREQAEQPSALSAFR